MLRLRKVVAQAKDVNGLRYYRNKLWENNANDEGVYKIFGYRHLRR